MHNLCEWKSGRERETVSGVRTGNCLISTVIETTTGFTATSEIKKLKKNASFDYLLKPQSVFTSKVFKSNVFYKKVNSIVDT